MLTHVDARERGALACLRVRRAALLFATAVLLAAPTVLAFFTGGYVDAPRALAGAVAWGLVVIVLLAGLSPLPARAPGRVALAGLVGLALWSAASVAWAPIAGPAVDVVQRWLLYIAALLTAVGLFRDGRASRAVEPALGLGALVVIGYGLAGRLLPGLIDLSRSRGAGGRLEQPITYWNAEGLLAAMGLILCVRLAGDRSRPAAMRIGAFAACAPLGLGVYLSYSRGAAAVAVIGLLVLLAAAPSRTQLRAIVAGLVFAGVVSACAAAFAGVASLEGSGSDQQRDGAVVLVILAIAMAVAGVVAARAVQAERRDPGRPENLPYARRLPALAGVAVLLCVAGLVVGGLGERLNRAESQETGASRFTSVNSLRFEYWRAGGIAFADDPLKGVGAGGFRVVWRQERRVDEGVLEVHSVALEMAAELGIPGLLFLALVLGGLAAAARQALLAGDELAAGASAACGAWLMHAIIDWDLQLPAVTLPAVVLAGALIAAGERSRPRPA